MSEEEITGGPHLAGENQRRAVWDVTAKLRGEAKQDLARWREKG